jgi:hypothetical protein
MKLFNTGDFLCLNEKKISSINKKIKIRKIMSLPNFGLPNFGYSTKYYSPKCGHITKNILNH